MRYFAFMGIAFILGISLNADSEYVKPAYLMSLHTHSSFSEGSGTMYNHVQQAEQSSFDGILWTDHMVRQQSSLYVHEAHFENMLDAEPVRPGRPSEAKFVGDGAEADYLVWQFDQERFTDGGASLRLGTRAESNSGWRKARLAYKTINRKERISLYAEPHILFDMRLRQLVSDYSLVVRVTLSSESNGVTAEGNPRVIEFIPEGMLLPPIEGNVKRVITAPFRFDTWENIDFDLLFHAQRLWPDDIDLGFREVEFLLYTKDGGLVEVLLDNFRIKLEGETDYDLFLRQKQIGSTHSSPSVRQYFGAEIEGPWEQDILAYSTRDHLVSMFPNDLPGMITFGAGTSNALNYPTSAVNWVRNNNGVSILAHLFSSQLPPFELNRSDAAYVASRVLAENAWGADGIEIGYNFRGRSLSDFIRVWDVLSENRLYLTGVGCTDDHTVEPWAQRLNRFGSWLYADDPSGASLCDSIREGEVFFGDPFVFDPNGRLEIYQESGDYKMGDVVPIDAQWENIRFRVEGASLGDKLILFKNGSALGSLTFNGQSIDITQSVYVKPGDWLRVEVHKPDGYAYLFSNPIYFIESNRTPPANRTP
jgi:hypothetical protein